MRRSHLYLVGFAAFIAACQPIAPSVVTPSSPQAEDNAVAKQGTDTPSIKKPTITITSPTTAPSATAEQTSNAMTRNDTAGNDTAGGEITGAQNAIDLAVNNITAAPAEAAPIKPAFQPENMIGLAMIRQEGSIEIWQYRFTSCVVDFFFYPTSDNTQQKIIKDWDMRGAVIGDRLNEPKCLTAIDRLHQRLDARS
ncbi:MAG: hypothetical protein EBV87_01845 [Alphaproteobacteria bacterium]|nr:hypothetical protein [Alphaproteobacteria bacterium]